MTLKFNRRNFLALLATIPAAQQLMEAAVDTNTRTDHRLTFFLLSSRNPGAAVVAFKSFQVTMSPRGLVMPAEKIVFEAVTGPAITEIAVDCGRGLEMLNFTPRNCDACGSPCYCGRGITGFPMVPTGGDITFEFDRSGIMSADDFFGYSAAREIN